MSLRAAIACLALALAAAAPPPAGAEPALDVLLVGDSITEGRSAPPGFRADLKARLRDLLPEGRGRRVAFIGARGRKPLQGHFQSGAGTADFYPPAFGRGNGRFDLGPDLARSQAPLVVAIHLGTNDLARVRPLVPYSLDHGRTLAGTGSAQLAELLRYVVALAAARDWPLHLVLSLLIPVAGLEADVEAWNEATVAMAEDLAEGVLTGAPRRVTLADHHRRFRNNPDLFTRTRGDWMADPLHPNAAGYAQMAAVYAAAITAAVTDATAPAPAADLAVAAAGPDQLTLVVTASGDDGTRGRAARYDLRIATSPIMPATFPFAAQARGEPEPGPPGGTDTLIVRGLVPGTEYHFALKVTDAAGNRSPMSNPVGARTAAAGRSTVTLRAGTDGYSAEDLTLLNGRPVPEARTGPALLVGANPLRGRTPDVHRATIRFDLSSIPARATVHAARLGLYCLASGAEAPVAIAAHLAPRFGAWTAAGEPVATARLDHAGTWVEWDLTDVVAAWVRGTVANTGLLLKVADETVTSTLWFHSSAYPGAAPLRPGLRIDYSLAASARAP